MLLHDNHDCLQDELRASRSLKHSNILVLGSAFVAIDLRETWIVRPFYLGG